MAVALTSFGGRDQLLLARMAQRRGQAGTLLAVGWFSAIATALFMAWAGQFIGGLMPQAAQVMLVALALLFAAVELAWQGRKVDAAPQEPTHSLGALFIVMLARQLGDSPRFIVFALAIWSSNGWLAAMGGALAGGAGLTLGWLLGEELENTVPLRKVRLVLAFVIGVAAIVIGLNARSMTA